MKKNVASQSIGAEMITSADGTAFTGTVTVLITIDNGTQSASGGTAPAHEGNGYHSYTPTQAETNGDHLAFTFTGTGAIPATIQTFTTFPQTVDNDTKISLIPTTAMRGTDSANTVVPPSVAQFNARTLVAASYFDASTDTVANVTTVATTTTNTDMRGTDSAATAANLATVDGNVDAILVDTSTTIPGQITGLNDFNPTSDAVANVTLVGTTTTNTDMRGTDNAATSAKQDTMETTLNAIPTTPMRGTDSALLAASINLTAGAVDTVTTVTNQVSVSDILTTQMTESYAADGSAPTLAQALHLIQQSLGDFSIAGTTITVKRLNGTTTAATYTLDDGTDPTSRTRAS